MQFDELKLKRQFLNALEDLGFLRPTPIQVQAIPRILSGQDVVAVAQTGTGKTAAFVLPILQKIQGRQDGAPRAMILVPTKELALQVHRAVEDFGSHTDLRSVALVGGVGPKAQIEKLQQGVEIVVATPGRFMELYLRGLLVVKNIQMVVLDEADRMMDMGFMPQLRDIQEIIPRKRQNLLFSATFPQRVEHLVDDFLLWPTRIEVAPEGTPVGTVSQFTMEVPNVQTKLHVVLHLIRQSSEGARTLIFSRTKEDAKAIRAFLSDALREEIVDLHSNKAQHTRLAAMEKYRHGAVRILVGTDVASRGIDVPETEMVINFNVPRMSDDYVHRIGRTGRAERLGSAYTLIDPTDVVAWKRILERLPNDDPPQKLSMPIGIEITETPPWEAKEMARTIDFQKRKADPTYKGAFHEKKRKPQGRRRRG
ncbi:MAG: DEAD/DEAH box helicase [Bacteroidetes bacterium]|nr:DEAD/DEAH box helicase [Bacteroidota bacterium]MDA0902767.1 DEAD/DEAH box helicase [Bacteroidota bacterium]MDA1242904.1 DEAD/DEAH box helicase [Bacteroidota bacterium]